MNLLVLRRFMLAMVCVSCCGNVRAQSEKMQSNAGKLAVTELCGGDGCSHGPQEPKGKN